MLAHVPNIQNESHESFTRPTILHLPDGREELRKLFRVVPSESTEDDDKERVLRPASLPFPGLFVSGQVLPFHFGLLLRV